MKDNNAQCFEKIAHEDCGSSNALQTYYNDKSDLYTGYCFSCNTFVKNPYGDQKPEPPKKKTKEELFQEVKEIRDLITPPNSIRKISPKYFARYGVRYAVSEFDGKTPQAIYYPYTTKGKLTGWKGRNLRDKGFWSIGDLDKVDPFGLVQALKVGAKRVYVCSGENDAIALDMILTMTNAGTKYSKIRYSIVSVPKGEGSIVQTLKALSSFDEIVIIPDQDEAGEALVKKATQYADNILLINPPIGFKDPHSVLESGKKETVVSWGKKVMWNAKKPKTAGIVSVTDILKEGIKKPVMGLSYPWEDITRLTYGQRFGEALAIGAGVGLGKTLIAHEIAAHNHKVHNEGTFLVLLEEDNIDTLRNVAGKIDSIPYHIPNTKYDPDQLVNTAEGFSDKILFWDDSSTTVDRFDMDEILKAIRFNTLEMGIKFHILDNMTCLAPSDASGANEFINHYGKLIGNMAVELGIHIDVFSHLNPPARGPSHEEGGEVLESQFTGSRGMMRSFPVMVGFRRNKYAAGSRQHNSIIEVLKNRKYGETGSVRMQFQPKTGRMFQNSWEGDLIGKG